jgi:hypothetical protein
VRDFLGIYEERGIETKPEDIFGFISMHLLRKGKPTAEVGT